MAVPKDFSSTSKEMFDALLTILKIVKLIPIKQMGTIAEYYGCSPSPPL